jgi:hypothetical protein
MARPRGRPGKTPIRLRSASNAQRDDTALHSAGHGPYAASPHIATILVIEESLSLSRLAAENLVAAGVALMRATTVEQAVAFVRNVDVDGIIICVGDDPQRSHWLRAGLDVLAQLPLYALPVAVVVRGALTVHERRVTSRHRAEIVTASSLRHVAVRDHLIGHLLPRDRTAPLCRSKGFCDRDATSEDLT